MKITYFGIIAVIVVGGIVLSVNNMQNNKVTQVQPTIIEKPTISITAPTESTPLTQPINESIKTIKVEAGSYYYKPNIITVKKGEKVKIIMNSVSMMHDFNIDELGVKMPIVKNGDTGTVEFTADKVGTFEYYCSVGQHRQMGQVGQLTVE